MPLGLLITIGTQFATAAINSKQSSKHFKKMQALQQEYEETVQKGGFERAMDKYEQLCTLQKEIEKEQHQRRLDNIEQSFNRYLDNAAYAQALKNWPLRVLPFVMKNESIYCNSLNDSNKKIALHCLLTRSNDENFNKAIYRELDTRLNHYFNQFWSSISTHPVLYYSGVWKEMHDASAVVDNLYNQLEQLPTIVINPWIDENTEFYFKISVWGIPNVEIKNAIYKPEGILLKFEQKKEYSKDEIKIILDELRPILVAFVGYLTDQYYWLFYKEPALLPRIYNNIIPIDNLYKDAYRKLCLFNLSEIASSDLIKKINFIESTKNIIGHREKDFFIEKCIKYSVNIRGLDTQNLSLSEMLLNEIFSINDVDLLEIVIKYYNGKLQIKEIEKKIKNIKLNIPCEIIQCDSLNFVEALEWAINNKINFPQAFYSSIEIENQKITICLLDDKKQNIRNGKYASVGIFEFEELFAPNNLIIKKNKFEILLSSLEVKLKKIKLIY